MLKPVPACAVHVSTHFLSVFFSYTVSNLWNDLSVLLTAGTPQFNLFISILSVFSSFLSLIPSCLLCSRLSFPDLLYPLLSPSYSSLSSSHTGAFSLSSSPWKTSLFNADVFSFPQTSAWPFCVLHPSIHFSSDLSYCNCFLSSSSTLNHFLSLLYPFFKHLFSSSLRQERDWWSFLHLLLNLWTPDVKMYKSSGESWLFFGVLFLFHSVFVQVWLFWGLFFNLLAFRDKRRLRERNVWREREDDMQMTAA